MPPAFVKLIRSTGSRRTNQALGAAPSGLDGDYVESGLSEGGSQCEDDQAEACIGCFHLCSALYYGTESTVVIRILLPRAGRFEMERDLQGRARCDCGGSAGEARLAQPRIAVETPRAAGLQSGEAELRNLSRGAILRVCEEKAYW